MQCLFEIAARRSRTRGKDRLNGRLVLVFGRGRSHHWSGCDVTSHQKQNEFDSYPNPGALVQSYVNQLTTVNFLMPFATATCQVAYSSSPLQIALLNATQDLGVLRCARLQKSRVSGKINKLINWMTDNAPLPSKIPHLKPFGLLPLCKRHCLVHQPCRRPHKFLSLHHHPI